MMLCVKTKRLCPTETKMQLLPEINYKVIPTDHIRVKLDGLLLTCAFHWFWRLRQASVWCSAAQNNCYDAAADCDVYTCEMWYLRCSELCNCDLPWCFELPSRPWWESGPSVTLGLMSTVPCPQCKMHLLMRTVWHSRRKLWISILVLLEEV